MKLDSPFLKNKPRLELISLMDVMFLVLVFFIYSIFSMAVHRGVKVDLPSAMGSVEPGEKIIITITKTNSIQLNGRIIDSVELLSSELARLGDSAKKMPVIISADKSADIGIGIEILAKLNALHIEKVSFQVSRNKALPNTATSK